MEYLTLKIGTDAQGLIYEKDLRVAEVFGPFVRSLVLSMIRLGLIREQSYYWATIHPGYDSQPQFDAMVLKHGQEAEVPLDPDQSWLTLVQKSNAPPDAPLRYFTVEVHTVSPDTTLYRKDFPLSEVDDLRSGVESALLQMGLLQPGETAIGALYVRSGDAPREQEIIHGLPDELEGLEIEVEAPAQDVMFTQKEMPECVPGFGEEEPEELPVLFHREGLQRLVSYVQQNASRTQETGGILIGDVYRQPEGEGLYVEIEDFIPASGTQADAGSLRFTHDTWQELRQEKEDRFSRDKRIVGWYHTHPPIAITAGDRTFQTVRFFSESDRLLHQQHFNKPWQVALVMDADSSEKALFRWKGQELVESSFHLYGQGGSPS